MSVIEDTRKVLQDFIAPELRALQARLDALEKRFDGVDKRLDGMDKRFDGVDARFDRIDKRFDDAERRADKRHEETMASIRQLIDYNSIHQRLARLELKEAAHQ